jgi:hypothetical protein
MRWQPDGIRAFVFHNSLECWAELGVAIHEQVTLAVQEAVFHVTPFAQDVAIHIIAWRIWMGSGLRIAEIGRDLARRDVAPAAIQVAQPFLSILAVGMNSCLMAPRFTAARAV